MPCVVRGGWPRVLSLATVERNRGCHWRSELQPQAVLSFGGLRWEQAACSIWGDFLNWCGNWHHFHFIPRLRMCRFDYWQEANPAAGKGDKASLGLGS